MVKSDLESMDIKDLEARIAERQKKVEAIVDFADDMLNTFGKLTYHNLEERRDSYALANFYDFSITKKCEGFQRPYLSLEYEGKQVLAVLYVHSESAIKIESVNLYESGDWEKKIDSLIEMGRAEVKKRYMQQKGMTETPRQAEIREKEERKKKQELLGKAKKFGLK